MIQVRKGVFETNSSSSHSLVVGTKKEFDLFKKGKLGADVESKRFCKIPTEEEQASDNYDAFITTYDDIYDVEHTEYTTPNGDEVVAIGFEYSC